MNRDELEKARRRLYQLRGSRLPVAGTASTNASTQTDTTGAAPRMTHASSAGTTPTEPKKAPPLTHGSSSTGSQSSKSNAPPVLTHATPAGSRSKPSNDRSTKKPAQASQKPSPAQKATTKGGAKNQSQLATRGTPARTTVNASKSIGGKQSAPVTTRAANVPVHEPVKRPGPPARNAVAVTAHVPAGSLPTRADLDLARKDFDDLRRRHFGDPDEAYRSLDPEVPIVLLPARIETRFSGNVLKIRIYPDEIVADSHEPDLTDAEWKAGVDYWTLAWQPDEEQKAWRILVASMPAPRAAWVVRQTTPTNLSSRGRSDAPVFPDRGVRKPEAWTRAVEARLLPDWWTAIGYLDVNGKGTSRTYGPIQGAFVREPLPLTVAPHTPHGTRKIGGLLELDEDVAWTVDFERAKEVGMALEMPLDVYAQKGGLDRLVVFGVKFSLDPDASAAALGQLFDAHHYTDGFAFLPQGTPTNNTGDEPSAWPPRDAGGAESFVIERQGVPRGDAAHFATMLGIAPEPIDHVAHADLREQEGARAMNEALFPATLGYFLNQVMSPVFDRVDIESAREFFVDHVRGRGHVPAFRLGRVPYGVLPISSLDAWVPSRDATVAERVLPAALRVLRDRFAPDRAEIPHVGRTPDDPDKELLEILTMNPSARSVEMRSAIGPMSAWNLLALIFGGQAQPLLGRHAEQLQELWRALGHPEWDPIYSLYLFDDETTTFDGDLVAPDPLSESDALASNYITALTTATAAQIRGNTLPRGMTPPNALLYQLLRRSIALSFLTFAATQRDPAASGPVEPESIGVPSILERAVSGWDLLTGFSPGGTTLASSLRLDAIPSDAPQLRRVRDALETLKDLPTAELERLFTETLDVATSRLDAWITGLYAQRLEAMRKVRPTGCHIGGYAWVENLRPKSRGTPVRLEDGRIAHQPAFTAGHILAPSMDHAAAAAVLRNAYLSHRGEAAEPYEVDLSSARVRDALELLEGVRGGQSLSALLGYRLERALHDGAHDALIAPLRALFPIAGNTATAGDDAPAEFIAAPSVVDGLALLNTRIYDERVALPHAMASTTSISESTGDLRLAVESLRRTLDSVMDLLNAEAVFQSVRGNTGAASAALDALSRGEVRPPEPGIAKTPRGGIGITHRVVLMMDPDAEMPESWSTVPMTPRARANPILEAWVAGLLGDPRAVLTSVDFFGKRDKERELFVRDVTLADLGVRGLDVLWLARHFDPEVYGSELEQRVVDAVRAAVAEEAARGDSPITEMEEFVIRWDRSEHWDPAGATTFAELMELARSIGTVIGNARALRPEDLGTPQTVVDVDQIPDTSPPSAELTSVFRELEPVMLALKRAIEGQVSGELHGALAAASLFGVPSAYPSSSAETPQALAQLMLQATSVVEALAKRRAPVPATASAMMKQCFGEDVLLVAARGEVPAGFGESLARSEEIGATAPAIGEWMRSVGRVRPAVSRWDRLAAYLHGLDRRAVGALVAQTPADGRWAALPPGLGGAIAPNTIATAVLGSSSGSVCGLWIDEWVEVVPAATTDAAMAVHYDDAGAEAGQCVLVAVSQLSATGWMQNSLAECVADALQCLSIRTHPECRSMAIVPA